MKALLQAYLGDASGSVPGHHNKANYQNKASITIKQGT